MSIDALREAEQRLFATPPLSDRPATSKGSAALVQHLARIQHQRIRATLPGIVTQVYQRLAYMKEQLRALGGPVTDIHQARLRFVCTFSAMRVALVI